MATPTEWLDEFQVNTGDAATGTQSNPVSIGLANGNILVAWVEAGSGTIAGSYGYDIVGKIYDPLGNVIVDSFQLNQTLKADDELDFDIAATNDGGFVMVYIDDSASDPDAVAVRWSRYDSTGDEIDTQSIANTSNAAVDFSNPQVTVSQVTNNSVVTFSRDVNGDQDIRGVLVEPNGTVGTTYDAAPNDGDAYTNADVAILTNGMVVSVYEVDDGSTVGIGYRIHGGTGAVVDTGEISAFGTDPKVATLANGNFVVVWEENENIGFMLRDADGNYLSTGYIAATTDNENEPDVVALPDGGFVVIWDNDTDGGLHAQARTATGGFDGSTFTVTEMNGATPDVSVTADGRIVFSWRDAGGGELHSSIWDPREGPIDTSDYDQGLRNFVDTDVITGQAAGSTIHADTDADANIVYGGSGVDVVYTGDYDTAYTGAGDDFIISGGLGVTINAGNGNDVVYGGDGINETLNGGGGIDTLYLTGYALPYDVNLATGETSFGTESFINFENLRMGDGDNVIVGTDGDNIIYAGGGNDTIIGGLGDDTFYGQSGSDTASYEDATSGVTIRLYREGQAQATGGAGADTFFSIENATGSAYGDVLSGDDGVNELTGLAGDDVLRGKDGDDVLIGGSGHDTIVGGAGADALNGGKGDDELRGDAGDDTIGGGAGNDIMEGGAGADTMIGGTGDDFYIADEFDTIVEDADSGTDGVRVGFDYTLGDNIENAVLRFGNFVVTGNEQANFIEGNAGISILYGGDGGDTLYGGTSNDKLYGEAGDDKLVGEEGDDRLFGGDGADRFAYGSLDHSQGTGDTIMDFSQSDGDLIVLQKIDANTLVGGNQAFDFIGDSAFSNTAGELRYSFQDGRTIIEADVDGDGVADMTIRLFDQVDLTAGDFVL